MGFFDFTGGKPYPISAIGKRRLYLISFRGLCELDLPMAIESYQKQRAALDSLKIQAALNWMSAQPGRTEEDATAWYSAMTESWHIFLSPEQRVRAEEVEGSLTAIDLGYKSTIATTMMQNRLAFHIELSHTVAANVPQIRIVRPWFASESLIAVGDVFRSLSGVQSTVTHPYLDDGVLSVQGLSRGLKAGDPLFLVKDAEFVCGASGWADADTKQLTRRSNAETQIDQIVRFFELEQTEEAATTEVEIPLVSGLSNLESMPSQTPLTGTESIGGSSNSDAKIQDSEIGVPLPVAV